MRRRQIGNVFLKALDGLVHVARVSDVLKEMHFVVQSGRAVTWLTWHTYGDFYPGPTTLVVSDDYTEIEKALTPLLEIAIAKKIRLSAEENMYFKDIPMYWDERQRPKRQITGDHYFPDNRDPMVALINDIAKPVDENGEEIVRGRRVETAEGEYTQGNYPGRVHRLQPECRHCLRLFDTRAELRVHRSQVPQAPKAFSVPQV